MLGKYFCHVCKLWDNNDHRSIYHCPYCNVCRVGRGLGIDYRHCMTCNCCVSMREGVHHRCISQALEGTCPVCSEQLRFSTSPLKGLPCGHTLHLECFQQYRRYAYTCPVCLKSMDDMAEYFGRLDQANAASQRDHGQLFRNTKADIICSDCGLRSVVPFRVHHHKCPSADCESYNTRLIDTMVVRAGGGRPRGRAECLRRRGRGVPFLVNEES